MMVGEFSSSLEISPLGLARIHVNWISDASGDASAWFEGVERPMASGEIERIVTRPSAAAAPSANYDITLEDERGETIASASNLSATATETEWIYEGSQVSSHLSRTSLGPVRFVVANAGASKAGEALIYINPLPGLGLTR